MNEAKAVVERLLGEHDPDRLAIWKGKAVVGTTMIERAGIRQNLYIGEGAIAAIINSRNGNPAYTPEKFEWGCCLHLDLPLPNLSEEQLNVGVTDKVLMFPNPEAAD